MFLLFADDVVSFSYIVIGLKTQIIILYSTAKHLDLIVNVDKSNIVVFRNEGGGGASGSERSVFVVVVVLFVCLFVFLVTRNLQL